MGATDITRAFFMPMVYMFAVWLLTWVLVGMLHVPPQAGDLIGLYIGLVLCILVERSTPTPSKGGR